MTLLSRKHDYAVLILSYLAYTGEQRPSAREIATFLGLSRPFVANILKELSAAEFVASSRGAKGGYQLVKGPDQINLADLFESLGGPFNLTECSASHSGDEPCDLELTCPIRRPMVRLHDRIRRMLRRVTLADINEPGHETAPVGASKT